MFGIDTLTISTKLDYFSWLAIRNSLTRNGGSNWRYQYQSEGIHRIGFPSHTDTHYYAITLQLSPAQLLGQGKSALLDEETILDRFPEALQNWLSCHTGRQKWRNPLDWTLNRIDFTTDIGNLMQCKIDAYLSLAQVGFVPASFHLVSAPDWAGSVVIENNNERLLFYDKHRQMQNKRRTESSEVLDAYRGTLRVEVQLKKDRLERIRDKADLPCRTLRQFLQPGLAEAIVRERVGEVIGAADYVNSATAARRLAAHQTNKTITRATHAKLTDFLAFVAACPSLQAAKDLCSQKQGPVSEVTFSSRIRQLAELGIPLPLIPQNCISVQKLPALLPRPAAATALSLEAWIQQQREAAACRALRPFLGALGQGAAAEQTSTLSRRTRPALRLTPAAQDESVVQSPPSEPEPPPPILPKSWQPVRLSEARPWLAVSQRVKRGKVRASNILLTRAYRALRGPPGTCRRAFNTAYQT